MERLCAANGKAKEILNWHPGHTLKEGLAETIEWVEGNLRRYRPGEYVV